MEKAGFSLEKSVAGAGDSATVHEALDLIPCGSEKAAKVIGHSPPTVLHLLQPWKKMTLALVVHIRLPWQRIVD